MIDDLLQIIAPHHCCGCDKIGTLLCDNCKYDIVSEPLETCVACGKGLASKTGICASCRVPYDRAWCIGERHDTLQRLIGNYKFTNARAAYRPLARLLDEQLPVLPESVRIVPVPTVASHIRERGYDHMLLIARELGRLRALPVEALITRQTATKQRDATRRQRIVQAKQAFICTRPLDEEAIYLLLDDVVTTGATVKYAAHALVDAGAKTVWVAAISRQPLD